MKFQILLIISFFASTILLGQDNADSQFDNSFALKSYAHAPVISDTIKTEIEIEEIPKITGRDIGGQLLFSPMSGIIFAVIGALAGTVIDSGIPYDPSAAEIIGILAGYSFGSALGVYIAASSKKYDPNLMELIGSSLLGELAGVLIFSLSNSNSENPSVLAYSPFILPPIFAIVSLNVFQQKKSNIKIGFDVQQLPQPNAYSYGVKFQYSL